LKLQFTGTHDPFIQKSFPSEQGSAQSVFARVSRATLIWACLFKSL
jgi:hypothetical protein